MTSKERESKLKPAEQFQELSPEETAATEALNAIRQFDYVVELIGEAVAKGGSFKLRPSTLGKLNALAVDSLVPAPGATRTDEIEIYGSGHQPPPWQEVQSLIEELCDYVNDNWTSKTALHLAAYVMWRLNWVHPYADGNGRTSRAASYLVLCVRTGYLLPGEIAIPEQIAADKRKYYAALESADEAHKGGAVDVSEMEELLKGYMAKQLLQVLSKASGEEVDVPEPPGRAWDWD